jgi:hypothetical protein
MQLATPATQLPFGSQLISRREGAPDARPQTPSSARAAYTISPSPLLDTLALCASRHHATSPSVIRLDTCRSCHIARPAPPRHIPACLTIAAGCSGSDPRDANPDATAPPLHRQRVCLPQTNPGAPGPVGHVHLLNPRREHTHTHNTTAIIPPRDTVAARRP